MIDWPSCLIGLGAGVFSTLAVLLVVAVWLANGEADDPTYGIEREP